MVEIHPPQNWTCKQNGTMVVAAVMILKVVNNWCLHGVYVWQKLWSTSSALQCFGFFWTLPGNATCLQELAGHFRPRLSPDPQNRASAKNRSCIQILDTTLISGKCYFLKLKLLHLWEYLKKLPSDRKCYISWEIYKFATFSINYVKVKLFDQFLQLLCYR